MSELTELVGLIGEPFRMVIEEGKVHEFAHATRSTCPEHVRAEDPRAPVTFLASSAFWAPPETGVIGQLDLDLRRVLHGGQEYVWHTTPPCAGQVLRGHQRVARAYTKQGGRGGTMRFIELVTTYTDENGDLVAEEWSTLIETGHGDN